jgi:formamidopyrimidine-DNA glycosylase
VLVTRIVHYIRKALVGETAAKVNAPDDEVIFGKVGCSGPEFEKAIQGKKIIGAGQKGKYFWYVL